MAAECRSGCGAAEFRSFVPGVSFISGPGLLGELYWEWADLRAHTCRICNTAWTRSSHKTSRRRLLDGEFCCRRDRGDDHAEQVAKGPFAVFLVGTVFPIGIGQIRIPAVMTRERKGRGWMNAVGIGTILYLQMLSVGGVVG